MRGGQWTRGSCANRDLHLLWRCERRFPQVNRMMMMMLIFHGIVRVVRNDVGIGRRGKSMIGGSSWVSMHVVQRRRRRIGLCRDVKGTLVGP